MVYFIPHWKNKEEKLDEDRVLNILNLFKENQVPVNLISIEYLPFLRYVLNEYQLQQVNSLSLFDFLQQVDRKSGFPITIEDLQFPEDVDQIYTPFGITLIRQQQPFGYVRFEKHGFIRQVEYLTEKRRTEIYDDRGFLSSIIYFDDHMDKVKQEYYNPLGKMVMTESFGEDPIIELYHHQELRLTVERYRTFAEIFAECINRQLITVALEPLLIDVWPLGLEVLDRVKSSHPILTILTNEQNIHEYSLAEQEILFLESRFIVTDVAKKRDQLVATQRQWPKSMAKILDIPMYPTRLNLGNSNSVEHLVMYWRNRHPFEEEEFLVQLLTNLLLKESLYAIMIEINDHEQQLRVEQLQQRLIDNHFNIDSQSKEYQKVVDYLEAKNGRTLSKAQDDAVKELKTLPIWRQYVQAAETYARIEFKIQPNIEEVQAALATTRVYIDLNEQMQLQKQSFAVNAGIPLILKESSDYVEHLRNGYIVDQITELAEVLPFYMDGLKNWNEALVESVAMIETNSSHNLLKKWRILFDECEKET